MIRSEEELRRMRLRDEADEIEKKYPTVKITLSGSAMGHFSNMYPEPYVISVESLEYDFRPAALAGDDFYGLLEEVKRFLKRQRFR